MVHPIYTNFTCSRRVPHVFTSVSFIFPSPAAHSKCAFLLRTYVSRKSAGKGRALLAYFGLDTAEIDMCYADHPHSEEEAVQTGLKKWIESDLPKTGRVLIGAMEHLEISVQDIRDLKEELLSQKGVCIHVYICVYIPSPMWLLSDWLFAMYLTQHACHIPQVWVSALVSLCLLPCMDLQRRSRLKGENPR